MATLGPEIFSFGFRLKPTPLEAATFYLPRLIAGAPLHAAVRAAIHDADVYASEPGTLARRYCPLPRTGDRFFFTSCRLQRAGKAGSRVRAAGDGSSWQAQGGSDIKDPASGVKFGEIKKLRYQNKDGVLTDWLMDEFSCCLDEALVGDRLLVLCKMYVSPKADQKSAAREESASFFAQPAPPAPPVVMAAPPQVAEPPRPKRMRATAAPAPPPPAMAPPPRACHVPQQAHARHCRPQPSAQSAPPVAPSPAILRDPFEARVEAADEPPCPKRMRAAAAPMPPPPAMAPPPRARHVPQQAPARHCRPQPSAQSAPPVATVAPSPAILRDPFEARVAAADEPPCPKRMRAAAAPTPPPPAMAPPPRARHVPQQAPARHSARHCRPQPSAQSAPPVAPPARSPAILRDPFEVRVAADDDEPPSKEPPAVASAQGDDEFDFTADFAKELEEVIPALEPEDEEAGGPRSGKAISTLEEAADYPQPDQELPAAAAAAQGDVEFDFDFLVRTLVETTPTLEAADYPLPDEDFFRKSTEILQGY